MAEKFKFTQANVRALKLPEGVAQSEVWDAEQTGFGVRVGVASKTFFVSSRVNGRQIRATVGKFPALNVEDARKKARKLLVEMGEGVNPNAERKAKRADALSLESVFKAYLSTRKDLSEGTAKEYRGRMDLHLSTWKGRHVSEITSQMVVDRHIAIGEGKGKNVANQAMRLLRAVMNFSRSSYGVPIENPVAIMSQVRAWYKDGRRSNIVSRSQMPLFFREVAALSNETARDYLMLVLFTGLRRNEAMTLRWENVDLQGAALSVVRKGGKLHILPLSAHTVRLLTERQARWGSEGYVFPSWSKTGHLTNVQHVIVELKGKGLAFTLHDLRRTFITTAESLDISTWAVKRLANHAQTDVTGQHYVVHDIDRLREPMERISQALLGMGKQK